MRCCLVTLSLGAAGAGITEALRYLAPALARNGCDVTALGLDDGSEGTGGWQGVRMQQCKALRLPWFSWSPAVDGLLDRLAPDLLHSHGLWAYPSIAVARYGRRTNTPWITSPHGMLDPWALSHARLKKGVAAHLFENRHLRGAACIHALCASEAASIRAYGLRNPIAIIPNGVEVPDARGQRAEVGDQKKILLFLGRLHRKKNLVNALRAWKAIQHSTFNIQNSSFKDWQFVVAGWDQGGHEADLKRLCRELGLAYAEAAPEEMLSVVGCPLSVSLDRAAHTAKRPFKRPARGVSGARGGDLRTTDNGQPTTVIFTGPAFGEEKDDLLRRASAFILPSFSEGLPMAVLEAWAYGLAVLMTDHCNLPEGFAAGAAIRIGTDVGSIAEGMAELIRSPTSDLRSLGLNGRALVEKRFTWSQVAAQMMEVYELVLGGGAAPGCVEEG